VIAINGASSLLIALIGWWVWQKVGLEIAVGVAVGGYTIASGWRLVVSPIAEREFVDSQVIANVHPYERLRLGENQLLGSVNASRVASSAFANQMELYWLVVLLLVLFVTHLARMRSADTWHALISPFVATVGDAETKKRCSACISSSHNIFSAP
jgi:hypothetical protein